MHSRRVFCVEVGAAALGLLTANSSLGEARSAAWEMVAKTDRRRTLSSARAYLPLEIQTITAFPSSKSPGGLHDFFSQADYFWPDPRNPNGPYVNRDGQSNPANFNTHREMMIALSMRMPALTAAWLLTLNRAYARRAGDYLRAWFVTPATRMNPNLQYAQGVHGVSTGRSWGIIDTLHLVEVARAASFLDSDALSARDSERVKEWFRDYLTWMKTSENGKKERAAKNNHATCWALQAAEFARLIGDQETRNELRAWFTGTLLPDQMAANGSFPLELARTKPYSYSIFNFDAVAGLAQSLKGGSAQDLTTFALPDGRGLCRAAAFLYPYLKDKSTWPYRKDVEHFDALPVRSPGLMFAGLACRQRDYIALWNTLNPDPTDPEIIRNYPIRQPLLWV